MAGVSVSHAVMFIASMVVAAGVAGALITSVDQISDSVSDRSLDTSEEIRTDVTIISDAGSDAVYDDGSEETITILAKNTGSERLVADETQVDVLVNGRFQSPDDVTVEPAGEGGDGSWRPGEVVEITITPEEGTVDGDTRVLIVVNGDEEVFRFQA